MPCPNATRPARLSRAGRVNSAWFASLARDLRHVLSGRSLLALDGVELDLIAFSEGLETAALNRRMMDEQILRAILWRDETEALVVVEPLHCACRTHGRTPNWCIRGRSPDMPYLPTAVQSVIDRTMTMFPPLRSSTASAEQQGATKKPEQTLGPVCCLRNS